MQVFIVLQALQIGLPTVPLLKTIVVYHQDVVTLPLHLKFNRRLHCSLIKGVEIDSLEKTVVFYLFGPSSAQSLCRIQLEERSK
jgi:hypothetical protein